MRARYPDTEGFIERNGVKIGYEVFGDGEPAIVFPPVDGIVHSRCWKAQVPYLARTSKVVTIDPRGNGRSDRPQTAAAYADTEFVADTIAVMDATGVDRAVLVGHCTSSWYSFLAAVTLVLGAAYTLWLVKRVVFGPLTSPRVAALKDLNGREFLVLAALAAAVLLVGVWPAPLLKVLQPTIHHLVAQAIATKL